MNRAFLGSLSERSPAAGRLISTETLNDPMSSPMTEGPKPMVRKYLGSRMSSEKFRKKKKWIPRRTRYSRLTLGTDDPVDKVVEARE